MVEFDDLPTVGGSRGIWGSKLNAAFQKTADELNAIPDVVATTVSTEVDSRGIVESLDLVTRLKDSGRKIVMGHRGGARVHPEHVLEGYRDCARSGFLPEVDLRRLASGELVACHDTTTERTMTGTVANVADLTYDEWKARQVVSPWPGGRAAEPCTWDEILAEFGGRVVIMAEVKDGAAVQDIIDSVTERGLHRQVILNSFTHSIVQQTAAAGIASRLLCGSTSSVTPAQLVADGIEFLGPSKNMDPTTVATYQAEGIKVLAYGWGTNRAEWLSLASTFDGAGFDDPWGMLDRYPKQSRDPYATGDPFKGWLVNDSPSSPHPPFNYEAPQGALFLDGAMQEDAATRTCKQSWAMPTPFVAGRPVFLRFKVAFYQPATAADRWIGIFLGITPDGDAYSPGVAPAGQEGYHLLVRRNGSLEIYTVDSGVSNTQIASVSGTAVQDFIEYEIEAVITISSVYLTNWTTDDAISAANNTYRPAEGFSLHFSVNGTSAQIRDVRFGSQIAASIGL